jgi:hypothetical protein
MDAAKRFLQNLDDKTNLPGQNGPVSILCKMGSFPKTLWVGLRLFDV